MSFKLKNILLEQSLSGKKTKPLVDAIKNRNPVTFYYSGPTKPDKIGVKRGVRVRAEVVAIGLSKKGNVIVRAYVQPPSVSKKGFKDKEVTDIKTGQKKIVPANNWRTFIVDRMTNISVLTDETFDNKRPGYKEGSESSKGPMVTTYVTTDWTKTPEVKQKEVPTPQPQSPEKPSKEPLPQPKIDDKPTATPQPQKDNLGDVFKTLQPKDIEGQKFLSTQDYQKAVGNLYKKKEEEWKSTQRELGKNQSPGEGTRKRFDLESNKELSDLLKKNNITVSDNFTEPENQMEPIQETIMRIKTLMLLIN